MHRVLNPEGFGAAQLYNVDAGEVEETSKPALTLKVKKEGKGAVVSEIGMMCALVSAHAHTHTTPRSPTV